MESQVVAKEQGSNGAMRMSERGISSHNILEERLRDEPKEHLSSLKKWVVLFSKGFNKL